MTIRTTAAGFWSALVAQSALVPLVLLAIPALFRRGKPKLTRDDAFADLFAAIGRVFEQAAAMKPEWTVEWQRRAEHGLPPKYDFGDPIAVDAAHDMRFATALLQRYRWKSVVAPLFDTVDEARWLAFRDVAVATSAQLLLIAENHAGRLQLDEQDWVTVAIEQFDEAARRTRASEHAGGDPARLVAEGVYQPVYVAIQLADRLIERRRFESDQRGK